MFALQQRFNDKNVIEASKSVSRPFCLCFDQFVENLLAFFGVVLAISCKCFSSGCF